MNNLLEKYISIDDAKQKTIEYYLVNVLNISRVNESYKVLDLGCGTGESLEYFTRLNNKVDWFGIDVEDSPEVRNRKNENERFISFDGVNIPFPDNYFDLIYCKQVLEHVRYPRELLAEVSRVLKPEGHFVGSTSHLEPFHSLSYWNYTPYGFSVLISEAKLKLLELRPSIDSLTLIVRRGLGCPKFFNIFWKFESPLNFFINFIGKLFRISILKINTIKLLFCGQFIFFATKEK